MIMFAGLFSFDPMFGFTGFFAAANRDPRRWEEPEKFNILRGNNAQCAFGAGIHRCVEQRVAQMEGEIILRKLAER